MVNLKNNLHLIGFILAGLYSFLPLIIDPSSQPPGDDVVRLENIGWKHYYYGHIPSLIIGSTLYYYSTFFLMYVGIWFFSKDISKWTPLIIWASILFLSRSIYLNMNGGSWVTNVNFFLTVLVACKLLANSEFKFSSNYMAGMFLAIAAPLLHIETGAYLVTGVALYALVRRKLVTMAAIILPGLILSIMVLTDWGSAAHIGNAVQGNPVNSRIGADSDSRIVELETREGNFVWQTISREEAELLKAGIPIDVPHAQLGKVTIHPDTVRFVDVNVSYWVNNFLGATLIAPILLTTLLAYGCFLLQRNKFPSIPPQVLMVTTMIPVMGLLVFGPLELNDFRIGVHLVNAVVITMTVVLIRLWQNYGTRDNIPLRILIAGIPIFYGFIFIPNTLSQWMITRV